MLDYIVIQMKRLTAKRAITAPQNQNKKPSNKQLINLERSVFAGESQTSGLPNW